MPYARRSSERDPWLIAWFLTLALHAVVILFLRSLPPPEPPTTQRFEPIQFVFKRPEPEQRKADEPRLFSELPPDRQDEAPKKADFLSNVTSRARDLVPGGDAAMPRLQGEGDVPMVNLEPDRRPSDPSGSPSSAKERTEAVNRAGVSAERTSPSTQEQSGTAEARFTSPMSSSRDTMRMTDAAGNSDFHQPEMANPDGNASLTGDVSLNTTAWDYAPWLQSFGRQLMRSWIPPPAYSLGILKEGGWATIEVEISRSGELLRLEVLEEQGHPSLSRAAQTALHSMGPIAPLPADFPEPTLILRIRMIYPRIRPRS